MTPVPKFARDVRMHGFTHRAEVRAVLDWIDAHAKPAKSPHRNRLAPHCLFTWEIE